MQQVASIVKELNAHRVCHNDLKENNVCVLYTEEEEDLQITLIDFGLATKAEGVPLFTFPKESTQTAAWTWIAPEVKEGLSSTEESDIFGVGYLFSWILDHQLLSMPFCLVNWI